MKNLGCYDKILEGFKIVQGRPCISNFDLLGVECQKNTHVILTQITR